MRKVDGGHIDIDNDEVENAIRPFDAGKKNRLSTAHPKAGQRSAIFSTIIENCRLCAINPLKYPCDVVSGVMARSRWPRNRAAAAPVEGGPRCQPRKTGSRDSRLIES
jgi:hypothetical protein